VKIIARIQNPLSSPDESRQNQTISTQLSGTEMRGLSSVLAICPKL